MSEASPGGPCPPHEGTPRSRRFDSRDGLILSMAAVVAIGLVVSARTPVGTPGVVVGVMTGIAPGDSPRPARAAVADVVARATQIARPFLMTWTPAVLVLALRRPRPPGRRLLRRPGIAAAAAATPVLAAVVLGYGLTSAWGAWKASLPPPIFNRATPTEELLVGLDYIVADSAYAAKAVAGAWLLMALGGWWRPDRHWIDRLGRALGAAWLVVMTAEFVGTWL